MAQDLSSLFGLPSQQSAEQAYMAQEQAKNLQLAQLTPQQQIFAMLSNAGTGVGMGLGGMMGGVNPAVREQEKIKSIMAEAQAANPNDPVAQLRSAATLFGNAGDFARQQALTTQAMEFEKSATELGQKKAAINAAALKEDRAKNIAVALKAKFPDMPDEALMGLATNDKLIAELFKPENTNKKFTSVTTKDGVFMVNQANPEDKIRIGDTKGSPIEALAGEIAAANLALKQAQTKEIQDKAQARLDKANQDKDSAIRTLANSETQIDNALLTADAAANLAPNTWLGGTWQAVSSDVPWTDAKALNNLVESLNSEKVIGALMELKSQSRTGATGFGALSEKELNLLLAKTRALDPTSKTFKTDLQFVTDEWKRIKGVLSEQRMKLRGLGGGAGGTQRKTASGVTYTVED